jgi:hypothetical protein
MNEVNKKSNNAIEINLKKKSLLPNIPKLLFTADKYFCWGLLLIFG